MGSMGDAALADDDGGASDDDYGDGTAPRALAADQVNAMVVEMVRLHSEGLLRLARRHSICADDAHDAYQRGFEIFLRHAPRLDPERAPSWLRTVVKHEAMAVRRARQRDLGPAGLDADAIEARNSPSPDERVASAEHVDRSAEALGRCKPQEVHALWLRAQGNSYEEIQTLTGWSRTKVNRCLYEGRQAFLARYARIESGAECGRWAPLLSALVDGEATNEELLELRPHLRNCSSCKSTVRELHRTRDSLAVVFPAASLAIAAGSADPAGQVFVRVYESVSNWLAERAASSVMRAQILVEGVAGSAAKATAVAATAATVAGGGAVAIDQVSRPAAAREAATLQPNRPLARAVPVRAPRVTTAPAERPPDEAVAAVPRGVRDRRSPAKASRSRDADRSSAQASVFAPASPAPRAPAAPAAGVPGAGELGLE